MQISSPPKQLIFLTIFAIQQGQATDMPRELSPDFCFIDG
jgi:hypothetical protein